MRQLRHAGAHDYGDQTQSYNGLLVNVNARPRNGLTFQGGINTGKTDTDTCEVAQRCRRPAPLNPFCNTNTGWITRVTGLAAYTVPKVDVLGRGDVPQRPGRAALGELRRPQRRVATSLGPAARPATRPNATVNLVEPGTLYGDRVNEVDLRIAKVLRFGRTRTNVGIDIYNLLNADAGPDLQPDDSRPTRAG